jgi:demethylmenaquinone methyltransferase/2-methoxy-6-polyprenyl-1,4-benzoquinol methylase
MTHSRGQISRVTRTKETAKASYDRLSRWYDLLAGTSEWKFVRVGLDLLDAKKGESILEIGFGTGRAALALADAVGDGGRVYGIDLSEGMLRIASERVVTAGLSDRVELSCGDGTELPFEDQRFDAIFTSFTLELFDTPEIPIVLQECKRVLRLNGRLIVVSMAKKDATSLAVRLYEWAHKKIPNYVDCRPIYVSGSLSDAGFDIVERIEMKMWGLPVDAVYGQIKP